VDLTGRWLIPGEPHTYPAHRIVVAKNEITISPPAPLPACTAPLPSFPAPLPSFPALCPPSCSPALLPCSPALLPCSLPSFPAPLPSFPAPLPSFPAPLPSFPAPLPNSLSGMLCATPGLVNMHAHTSQQLGRGIADDVDLLTWLHQRIWPSRERHVGGGQLRLHSLSAALSSSCSGVRRRLDSKDRPLGTPESHSRTPL